MALTVSDYTEIDGSPNIEVMRVSSTASGDSIFSRKFQYIRAVSIQNHGSAFATGVAVDPPKVVVTQGSATANAKITITHDGNPEVFSIILYGEL